MPLSSEKQQLVIDALSAKQTGTLTCPITKDSHWEVQAYIAELDATNVAGADEEPEERTFPAAVVMCQTCGYMIFVNLFMLGIADAFGFPRLD